VSYSERAPHPALGAFIDRLWTSVTSTGDEARRILPDGCIDLLVNLTDGEALVVGTMTRAVTVEARRSSEVVAVRFRPGGAFPFLGIPAAELTDRMVSVQALGLGWAGSLAAGDGATAMTRLEQALLARLPDLDRVSDHAVRALLSAAPPSVDALARKVGWTRQHLGRVFRQRVGLSPRQLARVARLQRATVELQQGTRRNLADAAAALGYFDEAHMARDFRLLAGITPGAAATAAGSILPIRSLFGLA
jgi:AraC-like DNA-binding protein